MPARIAARISRHLSGVFETFKAFGLSQQSAFYPQKAILDGAGAVRKYQFFLSAVHRYNEDIIKLTNTATKNADISTMIKPIIDE